jgi:hypothetical protein
MDLRKQVYLDAAEAVDAAVSMIHRYANIRLNQEDLSKEFAKKWSAISKIHIIGQEETLKSIIKFTSELNAAIIRLSLQRQPLVETFDKINILSEQIKLFAKERDRMIELMKQLNFDGNTDEHRWKFIEKNVEFERKRIDEATKEQKILSEKLRTDWAKFIAECYATSAQIRELLIPAVKAVRDELELPLNYDQYKLSMEESIHSQDKFVNEYLEGLLKASN